MPAVYRCSRCSCEYLGEAPPSCSRCTGPLARLPDGWSGRTLDHAPRTPRLLSARELRARRYARRPAGEVVAAVLGERIPQALLMTVSGLPGYGKSTWTLRALEDSTWERPILVAREEGFGAGLADRCARLEVTRTTFSDAQSFVEVEALVEQHRPDVIALDSATALGIEADDLLILRKTYPDVSVIAVVQSTKDGGHRGSQAWVHDSDAFLRFYERNKWCLVKSWFCESRSGEAPV